jgi:hypothetical protein
MSISLWHIHCYLRDFSKEIGAGTMHLGQPWISAQNFLAGSMCTYPGFTVPRINIVWSSIYHSFSVIGRQNELFEVYIALNMLMSGVRLKFLRENSNFVLSLNSRAKNPVTYDKSSSNFRPVTYVYVMTDLAQLCIGLSLVAAVVRRFFFWERQLTD